MSIEQYLPQIKELLIEKVLPNVSTKGSLTDKALQPIFGRLYEILPFPVRVLVTQKTFVNFCISQKKALFPSAKAKVKPSTPVKKLTTPKIATKAVVKINTPKKSTVKSSGTKATVKKATTKSPVKKTATTKAPQKKTISSKTATKRK